MKFNPIFLLSISLLTSCLPNQEKTILESHFIPPRIRDSLPITKEYKRTFSVSLSVAYPELLGEFGDTCETNAPYNCFDAKEFKNIKSGSHGLQMMVDRSQYVTLKYEKYRDYYLLDDTTQNYYRGYPVFVYNELDTTKTLLIQDGQIRAIIEARDSNYNWRPIQFWIYPLCGNSNRLIYIKPKHYIMFKIPLFKGKFQTSFRVKLNSRDMILYSQEYSAWMNYSQFDLPKSILDEEGNLRGRFGFLDD